MDWLTRLPWIGPRAAAVLRTHAYRTFAHLQSVHWTRLAAAMTFTSFLALFPLLALCAAVGAALLSPSQLHTLERKIAEQIPGISGQIDIKGLVANAGTVGLIAGVLLVFTGLSWVGSLRDCLRAVWVKEDEGHNLFVGKLVDGGVLLGLGVAVLVSLGASGFATAAVNWTADRTGISHHGAVRVLLTVAGIVLAVVADFLILVYLLTLLPGVDPPRRSVVRAALIGAIGFELLKVLVSGYLQKVAGRSIYGAFGTPVALLLWFNFMAKLLLYCAAWTATPTHAPPPEPQDADGGKPDTDGGDGDEQPDGKHAGADGGKPGAEDGADSGKPDADGGRSGDGTAGGATSAGANGPGGAYRWQPGERPDPGSEADGGGVRGR